MIYLLTVIFILGTECFGFGHNFEFIKLSGIGVLNLNHVLLIIAYIFSILKWKPQRIQIKNTILLPLLILFFIMFFQAGRNIIFEGASIKLIIGKLKTLDMFFFILPLIMLIKNKKELYKFINILLILGIVNGLVSIFQFTTGTELYCSMIRKFIGPFYRVYHPNVTFITFCLFISLAFYLNFGLRRAHNRKYLFIPIYIIAVMTTLHRSLIITTFVGFSIIILINLVSKLKLKNIIKQLTFFILLLIIIIYFLNIIGIGVSPVTNRIGTSYEETIYFTGTVMSRYLVFINQLIALRGNYLLGVGFQYNDDPTQMFQDPLTINPDITYGNILLFAGIIGLFLILYTYYKIIKISFIEYKNSSDLLNKSMYLSLIPIPLLYIIIGFFSIMIFYSPHLSLIITSIGILYLLRYFNNLENKHLLHSYGQ